MNRSAFYRQFFHFFLVTVLVGICYSNTLQNEWHFDDYPNIIHNRNIQVAELSFAELKRSLYSNSQTGKLSRPVANFSFALNYYFSKLDTTGYHLVNISIHILCAFFVYLVFLQTLRLVQKEDDAAAMLSIHDIALLGALLWALHPIQTQAVTYIVQRMASMAALFYMMSFSCYLRFRQEGVRGRAVFLLLALLLWLAGVFTKENAALLPLVLIAYEIAFFQSSYKKAGKYLLIAAGLMLICLAAILLSGDLDLYQILSGAYEQRPFTPYQRVITEPLILVRYLFLLVYPNARLLTVESDIFASNGLFDPPVTFAAIVFISGLFAVGLGFLRRFPVVCFGIVFYFINHLVESSFLGLELYFEHRNYLPSIFLFLALAYYLMRATSWYFGQGRKSMGYFLIGCLTLFLIGEGSATFLRNDVWKTEISLQGDSIEKGPLNLRPYVSIASSYIERGEYGRAEQYLREAERLKDTYPGRYQGNWVALFYYNAAQYSLRKSNKKRAVQLLLKSLEYNPSDPDVYVLVGMYFFEQGDLATATNAIRNALNLSPSLFAERVYNGFGCVLFAMGKYDLAIEAFRNGLDQRERSVLRLNLAATYIRKGERRLARQELSRIPSWDRSVLYDLYQAQLLTGEERKEQFRTAASRLYDKRVHYCEWLAKLEKGSDSMVDIYPDMSSITVELSQAYQAVLLEMQENLERMATKAAHCVPGNNQ